MKRNFVIFFIALTAFMPLRAFSQISQGHLTGQVTMPVSGVPLTFRTPPEIHLLSEKKADLPLRNTTRSIVSSEKRKSVNAKQKLLTKTMRITADYKMVISPPIDSIDLSPYAPTVANQYYPVCYAYATVYNARTLLYNKVHHITWKPDSTVFSTTFLQEMMCPNVAACQTNGFDTYKACQMLRDSGSVFKDDFRGYDCEFDTITPTLRKKALNHRVNVYMIFKPCDSGAEKKDSIIISLIRDRPVIVTWISTDSFNLRGNGKPYWQPDSTDYNLNVCHDSTNHSFCVVGFNNLKYGGSFLVMNSWGSEWGTNGFMWIKYSDMEHFAAYGIVLSDIDK